MRRALLGLAVILALAGCAALRPAGAPARGFEEISERLDALIRAEMAQKKIPALAVALVEGDATAWSQAYGVEDAELGRPATLDTVWRAGSVSKMFTDLAVMRLCEQGVLELDAPVTTWLPDFAPRDPSGTPITLRQLMAHRAGLVREPPVGSYFDESDPSLASTVASLNDTTLVHAPGPKYKYSNAGIAVVGRVVEVVTGKPFAQAVRELVLQPMGLAHSDFEPTRPLRARLAKAQMWTYWGEEFPAPTFELGMAPAGSLYTTVGDLARAQQIFLTGRGAIVRPESLAEMWKPQLAGPDAKSGMGLGFAVDEFAGTRRVGHDGAIYGFSTLMKLLPELDVGVVLLASKDVAHGSLQKITDEALACLARRARGQPLAPRPPPLLEPGRERALAWAGRFRSADGKKSIELLEQGGELWLAHRGVRARLRVARGTSGDTLVADDLVASGTRLRVVEEGERLELDGTELTRIAQPRPAPLPAAHELTGLLGEYGLDSNVLYVFEKDGELHVLIEWFFDYPLARESTDVYAFPDFGLYFDEKLVFERDARGVATTAFAAGVPFARRAAPAADGATFRVEPVRPLEELRAEALAATPPREQGKRTPELVDLATLDPTLRFDVRYATTNNFLGARFYDEPRAFLQRPAAAALLRAHRELAKQGFGLLIHDAYRPWYVTKMFWDATPLEHHEMVADPANGSRHNRGCAVDLTLYELATGAPVVMPSGYDEFSPRASPWYPGGTSEQRWLRETLRSTMERHGFTVYEHEWWHYDFASWREWPVMNWRFEEIPGARSLEPAPGAATPAPSVGAPANRARAAASPLPAPRPAASTSGATDRQGGASARPKNVLLIVVDTLRRDHLGCYGYARPTSPNVDRLASEGTRYTRAVAQAPWTTPSIGALLTSQYPSVLGIESDASALPDAALLLSEMLTEHGYATGAVVSHSFCSSKWNFDQGFATFDESNVKGHAAATSPGVTDRALEFVAAHAERPFFLWAHYFDPHFAYLAHEEFEFAKSPDYAGPVTPALRFSELLAMKSKLGPADLEQLRRFYDSEIAFTDRQIGRLLQGLRERGLDDETIVVFTADHGEEFLEHGHLGHTHTLYEELVGLPLVIKVPGRAPAVDDRPAASVDVVPTLLDALGIAAPEGLAGRSLLGAADGAELRPLFAETETPKGAKLRSVTMGSLKLVRDVGNRSREIYDLAADPGETRDLSGGGVRKDPALAEKVAAMQRALDAWIDECRARQLAAREVEIGAGERERLDELGYGNR